MAEYLVFINFCEKYFTGAGYGWLTPVILATQEAEIRSEV
jgi:hypothetical protein